jgi:hypothetical protein
MWVSTKEMEQGKYALPKVYVYLSDVSIGYSEAQTNSMGNSFPA